MLIRPSFSFLTGQLLSLLIQGLTGLSMYSRWYFAFQVISLRCTGEERAHYNSAILVTTRGYTIPAKIPDR